MGVYDHGNVVGTQTVLLERIAELFLTGSDHVVKLLIVGREVSDPRVNYYVLFLSPDKQRLQSSLVLCALIFSEYEKALVQCEVAIGEKFHIDNSQFEIVSTAFSRGYKLSRIAARLRRASTSYQGPVGRILRISAGEHGQVRPLWTPS